MYLANQSQINRDQELISVFGGYNHNLRIADGEFYDMQNMTSDGYPLLSVRQRRGTAFSQENISTMVPVSVHFSNFDEVKEGFALCCTEDDKTRIWLVEKDGSLIYKNSLNLDAAKNTTLVTQAGNLYAFPQAVQLPSVDPEKLIPIPLYNTVTCTVATPAGIQARPCDDEGNAITYYTSKPDEPKSGDKWYENGVVKIYSESMEAWVSYPTNYIKLSVTAASASTVTYTQNGSTQSYMIQGLGNGFAEGDVIDISGVDSTGVSGSYQIYKILTDGSLILNGLLDIAKVVHNTTVTLERKVPKMDFVVECNNRLWGCYYGLHDGKVINEIYTSALGDPTNWYKYQGVSTDSWTATVGVDGAFTGAAVYGGYPLFFKENAIIRVYGSYPAAFQLVTYNYRGIKRGSGGSVAICDEVLYYHSCDGILAYTGGVPVKADAALGNAIYTDAVAGALRGKYYVSMLDQAGKAHLFVYDTEKRAWHKEDDLRVKEFCRVNEMLYMVCDDGIVRTASGDAEAPLRWFAETGVMGYENPYKKYLAQLKLRVILPLDSELAVYASYDDGEFVSCGAYTGKGTTPIDIPFIPQRCDRYRLRLAGKGECKVISIYRKTEEGSE